MPPMGWSYSDHREQQSFLHEDYLGLPRCPFEGPYVFPVAPCHHTQARSQDFVMKFPLKRLKGLISSRRDAAGQENLGEDDELESMEFKGVRPIMVLHVHGGPVLSRKERVWFEDNVRDFVWDSKKR
ncbi:hypothetical protein DFH29DRAFT_879715 [Suillus ampliporus]|nr:hypothetical protein DFH29DRAFT_879715 [Suillus ampliporus]